MNTTLLRNPHSAFRNAFPSSFIPVLRRLFTDHYHESLFPSAFGALPDEKRLATEIEKTRDLLERRTRNTPP
jgi:hypothetical protein